MLVLQQSPSCLDTWRQFMKKEIESNVTRVIVLSVRWLLRTSMSNQLIKESDSNVTRATCLSQPSLICTSMPGQLIKESDTNVTLVSLLSDQNKIWKDMWKRLILILWNERRKKKKSMYFCMMYILSVAKWANSNCFENFMWQTQHSKHQGWCPKAGRPVEWWALIGISDLDKLLEIAAHMWTLRRDSYSVTAGGPVKIMVQCSHFLQHHEQQFWKVCLLGQVWNSNWMLIILLAASSWASTLVLWMLCLPHEFFRTI